MLAVNKSLDNQRLVAVKLVPISRESAKAQPKDV
jgi:hypothetical protein